MTTQGRRTKLTDRTARQYIRTSDSGEVEIRRNANGEYVIFHRELNVGVSKSPGQWQKGEAFSEAEPIGEVEKYADELIIGYEAKQVIKD